MIERQPFDKLLFIDIHNNYILNTLYENIEKNRIHMCALQDLKFLRHKYFTEHITSISYEYIKFNHDSPYKGLYYFLFKLEQLSVFLKLLKNMKDHSICNPKKCSEGGYVGDCVTERIYVDNNPLIVYKKYDPLANKYHELTKNIINIYEISMRYLNNDCMGKVDELINEATKIGIELKKKYDAKRREMGL
jgi:hypothetical protein